MPGVGKTAVGRELAARLALPFVDTDQVVEAETGRTVEELFFSEGQAAFRKRERQVIARLVAAAPAVIATGGGAMTIDETRQLLLAGSITVWLDAGVDTLAERLAGSPPRPLLVGPGLAGILTRMQEERRPFYAQAHFSVCADHRSPAEVAEAAVALLTRA
jgi:shikimate kinase